MGSDTIAAIATPFGEGAVALLRLSGPDAVAVADSVFRGKIAPARMEPRRQEFGRIVRASEVIDEVLLTVFRAPASYTGEDVVEIGCHGGILVTRRILTLLLENGARAAGPGEFTQRAFLNGKMDLTQAEAVMDLIRAQTDLALRAATEQLEGRLGARIRAIREQLLGLLAHLEAYIDFPDEDIDPDTGVQFLVRLDAIRGEIAALLRTAGQGKILREGVRTVICGAPNAGKSSLLNRLLGYERAIVSETPGTTRDSLEEVIDLRGIPLRLVDTAGIREHADALEREGIARARQWIERADLVLRVVDGSAPPDAALEPQPREILVINKSDLPRDERLAALSGIWISCREGSGMEALADEIEQRVLGGGVAAGDPVIAINARHQDCLRRAGEFADAARSAMIDELPPEFVSIELRSALEAVGEVVGRADSEELLGVIFSSFCIGK